MKLFLAIYIIFINVAGFAVVFYDKKMAKTGGWRVPEKRLFVLAVIGGAVGIYAGMKRFRHKTRHLIFVYGIPLLMLLNLIAFYFLAKALSGGA